MSLPLDPFLPQIAEKLRDSSALVLSAPPGAGKTTRIPVALFESGFADEGEILILEPRRIAARLAALRVAQEMGEKPGGTVGYSIRYESVGGERTRIRYLTEAILSRRMIRDPNLDGVSVVILDEFHERHLATDLALSLLKPLRLRRPGLKIVVMSATLEAEPVADFLSAEPLSFGEPPYDLEIEYEQKIIDLPLHRKVYSAVTKLLKDRGDGDILVFLPGSAEIRRSMEALLPLKERHGILICALHGDLPISEQSRAIAAAGRRKVILATNVAETSITIPGIAAVVDSGLARIAGHSAWSGFPVLATAKISKSSAIQRAGRAGRTGAGKVIRLYSRFDFESRADYEVPEIRRADLAETVLMLHGAGIRDIGSFRWFDAPAKPAIEAAGNLLLELGAIDKDGQVTKTGMQMLRLPVHPRLSRMIVEGEKLKVPDESMLVAALLSERDIRLSSRSSLGLSKRMSGMQLSGRSDLVELLDRFREAEQAHFDRNRMQDMELDPGAVHAVRRAHRHLQRLFRTHRSADPVLKTGNEEEDLMIAALAAFPDRVARRSRAGGREILLAGGGSAVLSFKSTVHQPMFMIAVDAEEKRDDASSRTSGTLVRLASAIEPEWLAGIFPESIVQKTVLTWNEKSGRVDETQKVLYRQITLEERVKPAEPSEDSSRLLVSAVLSKALRPFRDHASLTAFRARLALAARHFPEEHFPGFAESAVHRIVEELCRARTSLAELSSLSLIGAFVGNLTDRQQIFLVRETPERIRLNRGRMVKVHYEQDRPPWIESRMQDFFGMRSTPAICDGKEPLTLHLLAPNGRAVQVTQDLAGFWERHYPRIRRELQRRYPKHSWPEYP